jgi:two-component system response regulator YesN
MYKKIIVFFIICMLLTTFLPAYAQEEEIPDLEKPASFTVRTNEYGAVDYILKSEALDTEIIELIDDVCKKIQVEKKISDQISKRDFSGMEKIRNEEVKNRFLKEVLDGKVKDLSQIKEKFNYFNIDVKDKNIAVILFRIENYQSIKEEYDNDGENLLTFSIINIVNEIIEMEEVNGYVMEKEENLYTCIINTDGFNVNARQENLFKIGKSIQDILLRYIKVSTQIGISNIDDSLDFLCQLYNQAIVALKYRFFNGRLSVVLYSEICGVDTRGNINEVEKYIDYANKCIENKNYSEINATLEELFELFCEKYRYSVDFTVQICIIILYIFFAEAKKIKMLPEKYDTENILSDEVKIFSNVKNIEYFAELKEFTMEKAMQLVDLIEQGIYQYSDIINSVLKQMYNCYNQNITLESIADTIHVNPNYLSRLFKKETGESFSDYLMNIRIAIAKEILARKDISVAKLANEVGYTNASYFCKIFKKNVGISPLQYKKGKNSK